MADTTTLGDQTELLYNTIEDLTAIYVMDDPSIMNVIKAYANVFARFTLARVESELQREGYHSAAQAVAAQSAKLEELSTGV